MFSERLDDAEVLDQESPPRIVEPDGLAGAGGFKIVERRKWRTLAVSRQGSNRRVLAPYLSFRRSSSSEPRRQKARRDVPLEVVKPRSSRRGVHG